MDFRHLLSCDTIAIVNHDCMKEETEKRLTGTKSQL